MTIEKSESSNCLNCKTSLALGDKFCSECGQEIKKDDSLKEFIHHFLADYFTFDSKFLRSFVPLMTKPGYLTLEYIKGRRVRYILPLRMFIFTSIILFLVIGLSGENSNKLLLDTNDPALNSQYWNNFFKSYLPKIFFLLLPLFAVFLRLFHRKKAKSFLLPFLFSIHFHTFVFLSFLFFWIISSFLDLLGLTEVNFILFIITLTYIFFYLWVALIRVYKEGKWKSLGKLLLLGLIYGIVLILVTFLVLYVGLI